MKVGDVLLSEGIIEIADVLMNNRLTIEFWVVIGIYIKLIVRVIIGTGAVFIDWGKILEY